MSIRRALALSVLVGAALTATPTHAASRTTCKLLVDGAGDAAIAPMGPNIASVDILSADLASGTKNLVGVLRLASLATDPQTAGGSVYALSWLAGGKPESFGLIVYSDGTSVASFKHDGQAATSPSVVVDRSTSSIIWTLGRKSNPVLKAATKAKPVSLTGLTAAAQPATNINAPNLSTSFAYNGDSADHGKSYLDGAYSCVKGT